MKTWMEILDAKPKQVEAAFQAATQTAMNHNMMHVVEKGTSEALPMVDMLSLPGQPVGNGKEEMERLLDMVLPDALLAYENTKDS